jgi:general secretion pathway protein G
MSKRNGFTLIELLVVMTVVGLLLSIAAPRYFEHVARAKEAVLKHNLLGIRQAIDKFYMDRARYPAGLPELVQHKYLRELPLDPVTDRQDSWQVVGPDGQSQSTTMMDVRSGASGLALDGSTYASW